MADCFIFVTNPTSGNGVGEINLQGLAQDSSLPTPEQWTCIVGFKDNVTTMQTKIKACVAEIYLRERGVVIGLPGDKITFVGGFS